MLVRSGLNFCCLVPGVNEDVSGLPAEQMPIEVAQRKAQGALKMLGGTSDCPILACDTIVVLGQQVFGKPQNADEARAMLHQLSGNTHKVISGVCILSEGHQQSFADITEVTFHQLSDEQIDAYIATGEPFDKAGAYGIQGAAGEFVSELSGNYENVVGLPLQRCLDALGCLPEQNLPNNGKDAVRKQMKAVRKSIPEKVRQQASQQVCQHLMATLEFQEARVIAAYCAFGSELCFDYMAQNMPAGKVLAVPVTMQDRRMEFVVVDPQQILPGRRTLPFLADPAGITSIPDECEVLQANDLDIMLVPGLAFDEDGYRMGYGGGYYDTYMVRKGFHAARFGTFFEQQHYFGSLAHEQHDVPLPAIITQDGVRRLG